jgi:hypothetical protein
MMLADTILYMPTFTSPIDRYSGAHVMMKRSHNRKPLRMLLGSASASEARVRKQFGIETEITIEVPGGHRFRSGHIMLSPRDSANPR